MICGCNCDRRSTPGGIIHVVSGSHYHLEGLYHFRARRAVSGGAKQAVDSVHPSLACTWNDNQPHNDFHGSGKLKFWLESNGDATCQATWNKNNTGLIGSLTAKYIRIISTISLSFCMKTLQHESAESYGLPTSVTWLQLLRKQTNTGTSTSLIAETHWSTRTRRRANDVAYSPKWRHQQRLVNFTCVWSWRLCGINPAMQTCHCTLYETWSHGRCGGIFSSTHS